MTRANTIATLERWRIEVGEVASAAYTSATGDLSGRDRERDEREWMRMTLHRAEEAMLARVLDLLRAEGDTAEADLAGALHADADRALRVLDQLRIAGPWLVEPTIARRLDALTEECLAWVEIDPDDNRWHEVLDDPALEIVEGYPTLEAAQEAEDARLRSEGYALATVTP